MNIQVKTDDFLGDIENIVLVQTKTLRPCGCGIMEMNPLVPVNYQNLADDRVCGTCYGRVTDDMNDSYNQYYGYSGYDEDHDE